jgi:GNAT superfamily N-acetyltransferase
MIADLGEWLGLGPYCWEATPFFLAGVTTCLGAIGTSFSERLISQRWIRYRIDLADDLPDSSDVHLTPVTDDIIRTLRQHPDHAEHQLRSGFRFWDRGLRRAYVWMDREQPLCIQWLLTGADRARLRTLDEWAGMYPPLVSHVGQVENLFAFSTARRRGVATQFEYALYDEARRAGLRELVTHIHDANAAARSWAERTGWHPFGTITRYQLDVRGLRAYAVCVHSSDDRGGLKLHHTPQV